MGSGYYIDAYENYLECVKIDPEYRIGLEYLADISIKLYEKEGEIKYLAKAKQVFLNMSREMRTLKELESKIDRCEELIFNKNNDQSTQELLAKIDNKLAELQVEEANEKKPNSKEYYDLISDAIKSYRSALDSYKQLYSNNGTEETWSHIEDIQKQLIKLENIYKSRGDSLGQENPDE